jgi:hypothetical protein
MIILWPNYCIRDLLIPHWKEMEKVIEDNQTFNIEFRSPDMEQQGGIIMLTDQGISWISVFLEYEFEIRCECV